MDSCCFNFSALTRYVLKKKTQLGAVRYGTNVTVLINDRLKC